MNTVSHLPVAATGSFSAALDHSNTQASDSPSSVASTSSLQRIRTDDESNAPKAKDSEKVKPGFASMRNNLSRSLLTSIIAWPGTYLNHAAMGIFATADLAKNVSENSCGVASTMLGEITKYALTLTAGTVLAAIHLTIGTVATTVNTLLGLFGGDPLTPLAEGIGSTASAMLRSFSQSHQYVGEPVGDFIGNREVFGKGLVDLTLRLPILVARTALSVSLSIVTSLVDEIISMCRLFNQLQEKARSEAEQTEPPAPPIETLEIKA